MPFIKPRVLKKRDDVWSRLLHLASAILSRPAPTMRLMGLARELIRATSLLERTNRELRRKFCQVCCFGSPTGAEVAIYVQVKRLNARWSKQTWWEASHLL